MTTFTTTITAMYTIPQPVGYVVNVIFEVSGVDGEYTGSIGGNAQFTPKEGSDVIPYEQLTPEEVLAWIPAEQISSLEACVQGQIDSQINPPVSPENTPLPWSAV